MSDDSRASRLRSRRGKARERAEAKQAEAEEQEREREASARATEAEHAAEATSAEGSVDEADGADEDGADGDTVDEDAENHGTDGSVKDERVGTYMYLPESQKRELERVYGTLKVQYEYKYDEEFEKNRHFFPAVVRHGLETLDGMDAAEVRDVVANLD